MGKGLNALLSACGDEITTQISHIDNYLSFGKRWLLNTIARTLIMLDQLSGMNPIAAFPKKMTKLALILHASTLFAKS